MKTYEDFLKDHEPTYAFDHSKSSSFGYSLSYHLNRSVSKNLKLKALSISVILDSYDDVYNIATLSEGFTQEEYDEAFRRFDNFQEDDLDIYLVKGFLWFDDGSYSAYKEDYSINVYYWQHYPVCPELPSQTIL